MVNTESNFILDWTGGVSPKNIQISVNATEGLLFFSKINWEHECVAQNEAREGISDSIYNEDLSLMFQDLINKKKLLIYPLNPFEIKNDNHATVRFLVFYYWKEEEKNSWFTRLITKKETSEVAQESHLAEVSAENLKVIISDFLKKDYFAVAKTVNHHYPYFSDNPSEL